MTEPNAYKNKYQNENHEKNKWFCSWKHPEAPTNPREAPETKKLMKFRLLGLEMNGFWRVTKSRNLAREPPEGKKKHNKSYVFFQSKWFGTLWNSRRSDATRTMTEPNAYKNKYQNENHEKNKWFCSWKHPEAPTNPREAPETKKLMKFRLLGLEMNGFWRVTKSRNLAREPPEGKKKHNKSYVFFQSKCFEQL